MAPKNLGPNNAETFYINLPTAMVIAAFCGIAWFNTIELQFRIWLGFKRYRGLYFWSLVASSWGCCFHALGFLFLDFRIITQPNAVGVIIGISWWCMVTGQALVLYSRLHLVERDKRILRCVLAMIITNFFILHIPIMILSQVAYSPVPNAAKWLSVYNIYEKIQMTGFTIQELIISGLYLRATRKILRPGAIFKKKKTSEVLKHLIWVNIFIIFLDAALLSTEYANLFDIQTVFKAAVYSVKLRFELLVLNELVDVVGGSTTQNQSGTAESFEAHDPARSANHMQLSTVSNRPRQAPGNTYAAFASPGVSSPTRERNMDGVLKTTEVHVHGMPGRDDGEIQTALPHELYGGDAQKGGTTTSRPRGRTHSRTSSEIEFAARGAFPSYGNGKF